MEQRGTTRAKEGEGRRKVGVIQDVEKLRPKLHAGALRNLLDGKVLVHREIKVEQRRPDNAIAAGIAEQIRASARNARVERVRGFRKVMGDKAKSLALAGERRIRRRLRQ